MLSDPDVKAWLASQDTKAASPPPAEAGSKGDTGAMAPAELSSALDVVRQHIHEVAEAVPILPAQSGRAWTILELEFEEQGIAAIIALILGLVAIGFGLTWVVYRLTQRCRDWMKTIPLPTVTVREGQAGASAAAAHLEEKIKVAAEAKAAAAS